MNRTQDFTFPVQISQILLQTKESHFFIVHFLQFLQFLFLLFLFLFNKLFQQKQIRFSHLGLSFLVFFLLMASSWSSLSVHSASSLSVELSELPYLPLFTSPFLLLSTACSLMLSSSWNIPCSSS